LLQQDDEQQKEADDHVKSREQVIEDHDWLEPAIIPQPAGFW
jgi:hypothetical protein